MNCHQSVDFEANFSNTLMSFNLVSLVPLSIN